MSFSRKTRQRSGFTLVELLVAVAALGIVMSALVPFLANFLRHTSSGSTDGLLLQEGRWAIDMIDRDLNYSLSSSVTITGGNILSFSLPDSAAISYSLVNNEVCRRSSASGPWRPVTDAGRATATSLSFVRNSDKSVTISFQLQVTDRFGQAHSKTFTSRAYQMN